MICDLDSYSDENGTPREECLKALQNEDVKDCYLQDCPGTKLLQFLIVLILCQVIKRSSVHYRQISKVIIYVI